MERTLLIFWLTVGRARPSAFAASPCVNPNSLILSLIFFELIGVFLTSSLFVLQKRQIFDRINCALLNMLPLIAPPPYLLRKEVRQ